MFSGVSEHLSFNPKFLGLEMQNNFFEEKGVLSVVLIAFKCRW